MPSVACDNCGEDGPSVSLKPCSRCKAAFYCDRDCQVQHWKHGGHKQICGTAGSAPEVKCQSVNNAQNKPLVTDAAPPPMPAVTSRSAVTPPDPATGPNEVASTPKEKKLAVKVCANCEASEPDASLRACDRCMLVSYCSRPCQLQHWTEGFHQRFCVTPEERSASLASQSSELASVPGGPSTETVFSRECAICRQPMTIFTSGILPCSHSFHSACIEDLRSFSDAKVCPSCRKPLPPSTAVLYQEAQRLMANAAKKNGRASLSTLLEPAVKALRNAAGQGHASSQLELGTTYMLGIGVPRNDGVAM